MRHVLVRRARQLPVRRDVAVLRLSRGRGVQVEGDVPRRRQTVLHARLPVRACRLRRGVSLPERVYLRRRAVAVLLRVALRRRRLSRPRGGVRVVAVATRHRGRERGRAGGETRESERRRVVDYVATM